MATIELLRNKAGVTFKVEHFDGPRSWSEMEKKHLILWAAAMSSGLEQEMGQELLAGQLFGIPRNIYMNVISKVDKVRLSMAIQFLFGKNRLSEWLIPVIGHRFTKYHGPKSKLMNITVKEYGLLEHCYERFDETKNTAYLDHMAAILYRPRRYFGIDNDIRKPLREYSLQKRAERFAKLPVVIKWAIYLNYEGCRNFIHDQFKEVYKRTEGAPIMGKRQNQWGLVINAASGGKFGTVIETENSNLHKFLIELREKAKEIEK